MPKEEPYVGKDPDPRPFLYVSPEQRKQDASKPYDAKKTCWIPGYWVSLVIFVNLSKREIEILISILDEKDGFVIGEIIGAKGDLVTVSHNFKVVLLVFEHLF